MVSEKRGREFYILLAFFCLFVLFLYGPLSAVFILSFQGPNGGLTFPLNGVSLHWFFQSVRNTGCGGFRWLLCAFLHARADGDGGYRCRLPVGGACLPAQVPRCDGAISIWPLPVWWFLPSSSRSVSGCCSSSSVSSLPGIARGLVRILHGRCPSVWLIMFAVFNRFSPEYEEAARDLGATPWQSFVHVLLPMIAPSLIGVGLFGFTLSYDEFARTLMTSGTYNTLPLEIFGMTTNVTTPVLMPLEL